MKLKKCVGIFLFSTLCLNVGAIDHKGITFDRLAPDRKKKSLYEDYF